MNHAINNALLFGSGFTLGVLVTAAILMWKGP